MTNLGQRTTDKEHSDRHERESKLERGRISVCVRERAGERERVSERERVCVSESLRTIKK